uniref:Uncharacterized protein n=1 Tax=Romanomermis culicivorax TaxID=13658 RepID=A0A915HWT0_ROMCU
MFYSQGSWASKFQSKFVLDRATWQVADYRGSAHVAIQYGTTSLYDIRYNTLKTVGKLLEKKSVKHRVFSADGSCLLNLANTTFSFGLAFHYSCT